MTASVIAAAGNVAGTFEDVAYSGTGATQIIDTVGFKPDLVWVKSRTAATNNILVDSVRGANQILVSNGAAAESTLSNSIESFLFNGFGVGSNTNVNDGTKIFGGWCWGRGGALDIVTYTGDGAGAHNISHSLGTTPQMIFVKSTSAAGSWVVYHQDSNASPEDYTLALATTAAPVNDTTAWDSTAPTSTQFTVGASTDTNANTVSYVAYVFGAVSGTSAFGTYLGNGGSLRQITTGFEAKMFFCKAISTTGSWLAIDSARGTNNSLAWESSAVEGLAAGQVGFGSAFDGFKVGGASGLTNDSGVTYVYGAWG